MSRFISIIVLALVIVVCSGCSSRQYPEDDFGIVPDTDSTYKLAYTSNNEEICLGGLDANGAPVGSGSCLTDSSGKDWYPSVSPDGTKIAFYSDRGRFPEIYLIENGESEPTLLRTNDHVYLTGLPPTDRWLKASDYELSADRTGAYGAPSWSPDGKWLAFSAYYRDDYLYPGLDVMDILETRGGKPNIYMASIDNPEQVVNLTDSSYFDGAPAWSPDGEKIAFNTDQEGHWEIYIMNADGSDRTRLTHSEGSWFPTWSPDGTRIAYSSIGNDPYAGLRASIYIMNADGSNPYKLTEGDDFQWRPAWSPDGKYISWPAFHGDHFRSHIVDTESLEESIVGPGYFPSWFPVDQR